MLELRDSDESMLSIYPDDFISNDISKTENRDVDRLR